MALESDAPTVGRMTSVVPPDRSGSFRPGPARIPGVDDGPRVHVPSPKIADLGGPRPDLLAARALTAVRALPVWQQLGVYTVLAIAAVSGLGLVGNAAWQLWGSNRYTEGAQHRLADELFARGNLGGGTEGGDGEDTPTFESASGSTLLALASTIPPPSTAGPSSTALPSTTTVPGPDPRLVAEGEPVARVVIPKIGMDWIVVAGVGKEPLKKGPGWMPGTSAPGDAGNSVLSGHRTTYGGPFNRIDELNAGDRITVQMPGRPDAVYEVRAQLIVAPTDVWVAAPTGGARLTLTSCHPKGSARQRIVVQAELVEGLAAASATPAGEWQPSAPAG